MKYIRPLSKAALSWTDAGPLDFLKIVASLLAALAPVLNLFGGGKGGSATT